MDGSLDSDAHGKQSAPSSAALWSYSKQLSSRGFSRAFAKVFGPPASTAKDEKAQSNTPIEETNHSSINDDDDDRKEHADSGLSHSIVDAEMADGTLRGEEGPDNQDLAVQTLLNLKRDHSQDPSHIYAKPTAKKAKPSAQRVNQKPLPGEKLPRKNTRTKASSSRTESTRSPKEVLYRPLSVNDLVSQRQEILSAVALVTRTLLSGSYPSPYKVSLSGYTNDESISRPTNDTTTLHVTHMRAVCASLEKFTNDIIIPSFVGELHSTLVPESFLTDADLSFVDPGSKHANSDAAKERKETEATNKASTLKDSVLRAFFGTLVLLREVLVQNFDSVFGANAASGLPLEEQLNDSNGESMIDVLSKQIFVTAIVLTGISIFFGGNCDDTKRDQSEELIQAFFTCIDKYEYVWCRLLFLSCMLSDLHFFFPVEATRISPIVCRS